jgi:hypothetical protein
MQQHQHGQQSSSLQTTWQVALAHAAVCSMQVQSAAAEWHACAKMLQLCRSELVKYVVQIMVWRKDFCTQHKPRHRCTTHPQKAEVVAVLTPAGR